jgi:putative transposase
MVEPPPLPASPWVWKYGRVPNYRSGPHAKYDLQAHLLWIPTLRKTVLAGPVALWVRDLLREIATEPELATFSAKVERDHVHLLIAHRPHQGISQIVKGLRGFRSGMLLEEFSHVRKQSWWRQLWARGYFAVTAAAITNKMVKEYIAGQEQKGNPFTTRVDCESTIVRTHRLPGGNCSAGYATHAVLGARRFQKGVPMASQRALRCACRRTCR